MKLFKVTIRTNVRRIKYIARADSSSDAIETALALFGGTNAVGVTASIIKPYGSGDA